MALDKLKYTYQDPSKVSQLNVDDVLNVTNTINTATSNSKASIISPDATNVGLTLRSPALPIFDLQQSRSSSNVITSGLNPAGQIFIGTSPRTGADTLYAWTSASSLSSTVATFTHGSTLQLAIPGQTITMVGFTPSYFNGTFLVTSVSGTSGAYTYTVYNSAANFIFPGAHTILGYCRPTAAFTSVATTPFTVPMVVQGAPTHSTNLQEWQSSTGSRLASMNNSGSLTILALHPARIQDAALTGAQLLPVSNTPNLLNSSGMVIRALGANQQAFIARSSFSAYTITAATANGTTITYTTTGDTQFIYVGMGVTITGVVSTGNVSATAGTGFNLTGATIASVTGQQFTITNSLVDTYTSGGTATATTTADIQQWQNGNSSVVARIGYSGGFTASGNTWLQGGLLVQGNYGGTNTMAISNNQDIVGLTIKANSTQTNNLLELRDPNNNLVTYFGSAGQIVSNQTIGSAGYMYAVQPASFGSNGLNNTYQVQVINGTAARIAFMIKGAASQTGNLTEWQDSNSNVIALINTSAEFRGAGLVNLISYQNSRFLPDNAGALINTNIVGNVGLRVQNTNASATADLQQWQNSSGTVLSKIDIVGNFSKGDGDQLVLASQVF
jgi:hypothetical protein